MQKYNLKDLREAFLGLDIAIANVRDQYALVEEILSALTFANEVKN